MRRSISDRGVWLLKTRRPPREAGEQWYSAGKGQMLALEMFPVVSLISQAVRREVRLPNET